MSTDSETASGATAGAGAPPPESAADGETGEGRKPAQTRQYGIYNEQDVNINKPTEIVEALKLYADDTGLVRVLILVGRAVEADPKKAVMALGQIRDLDGDYDVISEGSKSRIDNVKTGVKRDVSIG